MSWIVKDSAGAAVERRPTPYVTDAMKQKWEAELMPRYATRRAALLMIAHDVQHHYGWLPPQALEEIAAFIGISFAEVMDCVSFYEEYHLKPKGKYLVQICRSISCELCGQKELSKKLQQKLKVIPGETTDDGRITFMEIECIGACDHAPCALVDEKLQGPLSWEKLEAAVNNLK
jgi:NADH-quinone oxidoreductase subunit E